jgi:hypothetical protein
MPTKPLDLCISVVSGGHPQLTWDCLHTVVRSLSGTLSVEIHLIDNASPVDWFASVQTISPALIVHRNQVRRGFAANHNSVISSVKARYYLLLNDDTIMHENCCEALVAAAEQNSQAGFFGAKLLNPEGTVQPSAYRFPSPVNTLSELLLLNRLFGSVPFFDDYKSFRYDRLRAVDFVTGAALIARATMLDEIGLLDEQFFMYSEETDWCMRARRAGWLTLFVPGAQVVHYGGQSSVNFQPQRSAESLRSHGKLVKKHFGEAGLLLFRALNVAKHAPRALVASMTRWPEPRRRAEVDTLLWSLGALKRPGLAELARDNNALERS